MTEFRKNIHTSLAHAVVACAVITCLWSVRVAAQTPPGCINGGMASILSVSPTIAHVGDAVSIQNLGVSLSGVACNVTNGQSFLVYPNGTTVTMYETNFALNQGQTIFCVQGGVQSPSGGVLPGCLPVALSYVIQAGDVNKALSFTTPRGFTSGSVPAQANKIQFLAVSDGILSGTAQTAGGQGNAAVTIVHPSIAVSKQCVTNCAPYSSPYGQPIQFQGWVTNTGDITLTNVTVVDNPVATIAYDATTKLGNPFLVGGVRTLIAGDSVRYSGSYTPVANLCGPFMDTVQASATDIAPIPATVTASANATCLVCTTPCIGITKVCPPGPLPCNTTNVVVTGVVTNCGNVPLSGVKVVDDNGTPGNPADDITVTIGNLAIGASVNWKATNTVGPGFTGSITNVARATGTNICTLQQVAAQASCSVRIDCPPDICVTKLIACAPAGDNLPSACGTLPQSNYKKTATGAAGTNRTEFCYQVVVWNCGQDVLTNVTVQDNLLGTLSQFPSTLAIGQKVTNYYNQSYGLSGGGAPSTNVNTVVATGTGASTGIVTNKQDSATAIVLPISVRCEINLTGFVQPPSGGCQATLASNGPVQFSLTVYNTGKADLDVSMAGVPALYDCGLLTPIPVPAVVRIPVGGSTNFSGCTDVTCPGTNFVVYVQGTAVATNGLECIYDVNGNAIKTALSQCEACVNCVQPVTCRTTGGGTLIEGTLDTNCTLVATTIYPPYSVVDNGPHLLVNKITHGGQLGAPFSMQDCGEILGNPCIRGQWQHVRHYQGKGNPRDVVTAFHSNTPKGQFDTLLCACLGCCPAPGQTNLPVMVDNLCNPDDHKVCGPEPRPAPANAIIFTGIGSLVPTDDLNGGNNKQAVWVIFRVYIEDRSEPGGKHPKGAIDPADIYAFQAWYARNNGALIPVSKKPNYDLIEPELRSALGRNSCDFLNALSSGAVTAPYLQGLSTTINTMVNGQLVPRAADIIDQGPLHDGNHQIHPSTSATCNQ